MENTQEQLNQENNLNQNLPPTNPIRNQKGNFLLIIGVVILMFVVGAGGYFFYQKQFNKPVTIPQTSQLKPSPTPDETANWKTYIDQENKFSIKYPPDLISAGRAFYKKDEFQRGKPPELAESFLVTDIVFQIAAGTYTDRFETYNNAPENSLVKEYGYMTLRKYTIDGYNAVEYGYDEEEKRKEIKENEEAMKSGASVMMPLFNKGLIINKDGTVIEISTNSYHGDFKNTFDQILSTFQFTGKNQTNETASWETYKNSKYGFELQHPVNSTVETRTNGGVNPYQYIRIQNYTDQDVMKNNERLIAGQYYLEISIYDHQLGQKNSETCPESLANPKKVDLGAGVTAYRGNGLGGGDSAAYIYAICANKPNIDYYIQASENFDKVASKIIDSFKFTN